MQDAPERMNKSATCSPTSAKSVQECSGSDLENTRRDLIALRVKHGADSPIGRRCSNIVELLQAPEVPKVFLVRQMADLERLLAE